jgi:hypothetical protein
VISCVWYICICFFRQIFFTIVHVLVQEFKYSQTCIKRSPWEQRKSGLLRPLKRGWIHMKFSMTGQEKGDLLIQVTAWAGLTVHVLYITSITISSWKVKRQGVCNTLMHAICVTDDKGNVPFVVVIIMSFLSSVGNIFFKHSPKWRVDWNKYLPKWNRARHVWRVTFFLNSPTNTK